MLFSLNGDLASCSGKCPISHSVLIGTRDRQRAFPPPSRYHPCMLAGVCFPRNGKEFQSGSGVKARAATLKGLGLDAASQDWDRITARGKHTSSFVCYWASASGLSWAPSGIAPVLRNLQSSMSNRLARATIPIFRTRLPPLWNLVMNHWVSLLLG